MYFGYHRQADEQRAAAKATIGGNMGNYMRGEFEGIQFTTDKYWLSYGAEGMDIKLADIPDLIALLEEIWDKESPTDCLPKSDEMYIKGVDRELIERTRALLAEFL